MADLPTGTVTLLFTDIEGSTRLWEAHAAAMRAALARHDALLRQCIDDHDGHVFKTGGDAFCAAFHTASDAMAAALEAQRALHREPWPEGAKLRVRMALHSGAVEAARRRLFRRAAQPRRAAARGRSRRPDASFRGDARSLPRPPAAARERQGARRARPQGPRAAGIGVPGLPSGPAAELSAAPLASRAARSKDTPSIAVLPFVNMSRDEENEYFADGLSEELLNVLAKIRGLRVASRTSAFSFKGKDVDIPTVAQKLNVATVLEGSVRKSGKRVRITAQLIEVASDSHLWSETYDRELDDIFAVQDDIAQSVVKELRTALLGEPAATAATTPRPRPKCARPRPAAATIPRRSSSTCRRKFHGERDHAGRYRQARSSSSSARSRSIPASRWRGRACRGSTRRRRAMASRRSTKATSAPARPRSARSRSRPDSAEGHIELGHDPASCTTGTGRRPTPRTGARWSSLPATPTRCARRPASRGSWAGATRRSS